MTFNLGIVGCEGKKFTKATEQLAREIIRMWIIETKATCVVSGECHLGGIDIWAKEEALTLGLEYLGFPPKTQSWEDGYKPRNLQIARNSDKVICITLNKLPPHYNGMTFSKCYHCNTDTHVKSGGCWTVKQAKLMGKPGEIVVIPDV